MPSLHGDASSDSSLVLPILSERIMSTIRAPLQRLHKYGMPAWYPEIEASIEKLVQLGMKVSQFPEAAEVRHKLHAMADAVPALEAVHGTINKHLVRRVRDNTNHRCDVGHLSLILGLVDGWLRSCEEYVRRHCNRRLADVVTAFEDIDRELITIAKPHLRNKSYTLDHLLCLFDNLGLTKSGVSEDDKE